MINNKILIIICTIILSSAILFPVSSFSQSSPEGQTKEVMIETIVNKIVDGEPVVEKQQTKAILYTIPQPQLQGCERTEGTIPWSARLQNDSKILPDIQTEIDSGKETLCVTIVLPFIGPEYSDEPEDLGTVLSNFESISKFVMENEGIVERKRVNFSEYIHRYMTYVDASIPTSLIPELVEKEEIIVIDKYGKYPKIPSYIVHGYDSKIGGAAQEKIDSGEEIINLSIMLETIPMWPNGWPDKTSYPTKEQIAQRSEERRSESQIMQEPIVTLLEENGIEITYTSHWINIIHANVPVSFIPELEEFDVVEKLEDYSDVIITSQGSSASMEKNDSIEIPSTTMLDITVSDNTAKLEFSGNFEELKEIVIPEEITDKKLDVTINGIVFDDYTISQQQDSTYLLLNAFEEDIVEESDAKDVVIEESKPDKQILSPKQQIKAGVIPDEIKCKEGLSLVFKSSDIPACVKQSTAEKLIKRGWTYSSE